MSEDLNKEINGLFIDVLEKWIKIIDAANTICRATMDKSVFEYLRDEYEKVKKS